MDNPGLWWLKVDRSKYPALFKMTINVISILSTRCECESCFITAGRTITNDQNSLSASTMSAWHLNSRGIQCIGSHVSYRHVASSRLCIYSLSIAHSIQLPSAFFKFSLSHIWQTIEAIQLQKSWPKSRVIECFRTKRSNQTKRKNREQIVMETAPQEFNALWFVSEAKGQPSTSMDNSCNLLLES